MEVVWLKLRLFWSLCSSCQLVDVVSNGSYSYPSRSAGQFDQCDQSGRGLWGRSNLIRRARGFLLRLDAGHASGPKAVPLELTFLNS
jgi:hypothetical protein